MRTALQTRSRMGLKNARRRPRRKPLDLPSIERGIKCGPGAPWCDTRPLTACRVAALTKNARYHLGHAWWLLRKLRWSGQQPTELLDGTRLPSRRGGAGGGQQTSRFGQTIVSDDSGLSAPPIDAAMGSARPDLDARGSRQPAVALDDGQHHMVHLYFPHVPVMVCTTTGTLVPRTSPAPCARQIHALPAGWVPVAVDRPRVPPRIARPTTCSSMCRPMLLNSTRWRTSQDVGSGMGHPPVRTTLGQLGHGTAALLPAWPGGPRRCALCPAGEIL
jgi:hypothetical protein